MTVESGPEKDLPRRGSHGGEPTFWELVKEDYAAHGRDFFSPGFQTILVARFGVWQGTRIKSRILRQPFKYLYKWLYRRATLRYGIELPATVKLGRRVIFEHHGGIVIHGFCEIGDDCILRQGVTLGLRYLDRPADVPKLGKRVNIGAGAKAFGAISIGDDVNIGANAVVLVDLPPGATAVGVPATIVKIRGQKP